MIPSFLPSFIHSFIYRFLDRIKPENLVAKVFEDDGSFSDKLPERRGVITEPGTATGNKGGESGANKDKGKIPPKAAPPQEAAAAAPVEAEERATARAAAAMTTSTSDVAADGSKETKELYEKYRQRVRNARKKRH